jgi:ABC-type phosphate transport system permease subunit
MNATTNEVRLAGIENTNQAAELTAGTRFAQNSLLSELPGIVFGLITLGYIVSSLVALA